MIKLKTLGLFLLGVSVCLPSMAAFPLIPPAIKDKLPEARRIIVENLEQDAQPHIREYVSAVNAFHDFYRDMQAKYNADVEYEDLKPEDATRWRVLQSDIKKWYAQFERYSKQAYRYVHME